MTVQWEKMSKSRGNVVTPDEVIYGVAAVDPSCEFRDERGAPIPDPRSLGIWRDKGDTQQFFTGARFGRRPVFLHRRGNPVPAALDTPAGVIVQHPGLDQFWSTIPGGPQ